MAVCSILLIGGYGSLLVHTPSDLPPTQVHVVLSEVESEPHVNCDDEVDSSDDAVDYEDEDLSDTDPEDEWNTSDLPLSKV